MILALLLQAAPVTSAPTNRAAPPQRFSILADPCARVQRDGKDVVVCGQNPATTQRLPYPEEVVPDHGIASNPMTNGVGALAAEATPCAATQWGCQVGVGPPIYPLAVALVNGIRNAKKERAWAKARAADGDRRQAIDLDAEGPKGRVEP